MSEKVSEENTREINGEETKGNSSSDSTKTITKSDRIMIFSTKEK